MQIEQNLIEYESPFGTHIGLRPNAIEVTIEGLPPVASLVRLKLCISTVSNLYFPNDRAALVTVHFSLSRAEPDRRFIRQLNRASVRRLQYDLAIVQCGSGYMRSEM